VSIQIVLPAIWILTAALVLKLVNDWSHLPQRVAVHFDTAMQPDGWSSRRVLSAMILVAAIGEASFASWLLLNLGSGSVITAAVLLGVNAVFVCVFWQIINFNAHGVPVRARWIVIPLLLLVAGFGVYMAMARH